MAVFPTGIADGLHSPSTGDTIAATDVSALVTEILSIEAKVGKNSSAVAISHDYLLTHLPAQGQDLDIGAYELRAQTLESDVVTGTAPLTIASTTMVDNLNANYVGGTALAGLQTILTNSAGLLAALSDETGTGVAVFNDTPTLVTPALGAATATTINKVTITAPAASATLTIANTKTLTVTGDATISTTPYAPVAGDLISSTVNTARTGWTNVSATYANKFMRISATPLSTGGADTHTHAVGSFVSPTTGSHTLTATEMPAHTHTFSWGIIGAGGSYLDAEDRYAGATDSTTSSSAGSGGGHTHTGGAITGTSAAGDNVPAYLTVCIFQKDA